MHRGHVVPRSDFFVILVGKRIGQQLLSHTDSDEICPVTRSKVASLTNESGVNGKIYVPGNDNTTIRAPIGAIFSRSQEDPHL